MKALSSTSALSFVDHQPQCCRRAIIRLKLQHLIQRGQGHLSLTQLTLHGSKVDSDCFFCRISCQYWRPQLDRGQRMSKLGQDCPQVSCRESILWINPQGRFILLRGGANLSVNLVEKSKLRMQRRVL